MDAFVFILISAPRLELKGRHIYMGVPIAILYVLVQVVEAKTPTSVRL